MVSPDPIQGYLMYSNQVLGVASAIIDLVPDSAHVSARPCEESLPRDLFTLVKGGGTEMGILFQNREGGELIPDILSKILEALGPEAGEVSLALQGQGLETGPLQKFSDFKWKWCVGFGIKPNGEIIASTSSGCVEQVGDCEFLGLDSLDSLVQHPERKKPVWVNLKAFWQRYLISRRGQ